MSQFFASGSQSIGASALASVLPKTIQGWSLRIDWFHLLAVQGTFRSLLQHHSLKVSILWCSAFFFLQSSSPYTLPSNPTSRTFMEFLSLWQVFLNAHPKPSVLMTVPTTISNGVKCSSWPLNHQSHIHVFIFHILLEFTCKGSKFTRPQCEPVKQYFLFFWLKCISHKTSWDVCCSWTLPNLLYPDHLTSIIFHIIFFSKQCLVLYF